MAAVGVLGGTGPLGRGLGLRLALAGHDVSLGSRSAERGEQAAAELREAHEGLAISGAGNDEVVASADLVLVCVPYDGLDDTVTPLAEALAGRIVCSCVNALAFDDGGPVPVAVPEGSAAQRCQRLLPQARMVAAFHHVSAVTLCDASQTLDGDVLVLGDDEEACGRVAELAADIPRLRAVRGGPLRLSGPVEELTAVLIAINQRYRTHAGVTLTGVAEPSA